MNLRVLTYNIHKGFSFNNRQFILHEIREGLRSTDVDLVFIQEIHGEQLRHQGRIGQWPVESQFEFLADSVWPHYAYGKNAIYNHGHHGNAILSKYPIKQSRNIILSRLKRASRGLLHGIIELPGYKKDLHVICVHLELFRFEQRRQLEVIRQHILEFIDDNEPLVVAGDFNDWRGRSARFLGRELGLVEAHHQRYGAHAFTYPAFWPVLKVDRIYFRGIELSDAGCLTGNPWDTLSDHSPLYAEFRI